MSPFIVFLILNIVGMAVITTWNWSWPQNQSVVRSCGFDRQKTCIVFVQQLRGKLQEFRWCLTRLQSGCFVNYQGLALSSGHCLNKLLRQMGVRAWRRAGPTGAPPSCMNTLQGWTPMWHRTWKSVRQSFNYCQCQPGARPLRETEGELATFQ